MCGRNLGTFNKLVECKMERALKEATQEFFGPLLEEMHQSGVCINSETTSSIRMVDGNVVVKISHNSTGVE